MLKSASGRKSSNIRIGKSQWSVMFCGNGKANKIIRSIIIIMTIITAQRTDYCDYGNFFNNTNFYDYLDYTWIVGGPCVFVFSFLAWSNSALFLNDGVNYLEWTESQVDARELN